MTAIRVADLLAGSIADPAAHLEPERVARYAEIFDQLPPVVVFQTENGLLLADGYHRLAAAQALGRETVEAELRRGSRRDALAYAVRVGALERGVTPEEAMDRIRRWSQGRSGGGEPPA